MNEKIVVIILIINYCILSEKNVYCSKLDKKFNIFLININCSLIIL